jgi:chromosome segregation ATPase
MQNIAKRLLGTNTDPVTDLVSLRSRHSDAARKVAQGATELDTLTTLAAALRLQRARLLEARDEDPGVDLFVPLRTVEGQLASAQKRLDDLQDVMKVRQDNAETLAAQVRSAEQAAAPRRMKALVADHGRDREALRTAMTDLRSLAARILAGEADMQALYHAHGIQATGVLVIEGLATTAQATAADILGRLTWQDEQLRLGDALADKIAADRDEVDRRNQAAGVPGMWRAPGSDFFKGGWVDESVEDRTARVSG